MANDYALEAVQTEVMKSTNNFTTPFNKYELSKALTKMSLTSRTKTIRRSLFTCFRIYVHEYKSGETVNIKIPLPIPLLSLIFRNKISLSQTLKLAGYLEKTNFDNLSQMQKLASYLDSFCGLELIRVEDKDELVIIGFD